ncbi:uncharacterized protein LOC124406309 [Diprion similis]|uniref:uncharacterized protein LOC124406309 n=1 Tax=Diprion similis TaxID=362088 RepID=UPI001EF86454|nr:uncharacterized protein LOC124406309 [Diprion similis]
MYKFAVILVLLAGTACAFPPNNIWGESVAEDIVDKKAPEVPWQGSEVEIQKEDATRESDDDLTPTIAISRTKTPSPASSDRSTEENEEAKTLCAEDEAPCDSLDEATSRQKRNTEKLSWNQITNFPMDNVKVITMDDLPNFQGINIPDLSNIDFEKLVMGDVKGFEIPNSYQIQIPNLSGIQIPDLSGIQIPDLSKLGLQDLLDGQIKIENIPDLQGIKITDGILNGSSAVGVIFGNANDTNILDGSFFNNAGAGNANSEAVGKLQKEVEALTKKLEEAEKNLALKELAIKENEGKKEECKTLQEKHDAKVKALTEELGDLRKKSDEQSKNFTTIVVETDNKCEKTLKDNEEREKQERKTLQEKHDAEIESLKASLTAADQFSSKLTAELNRLTTNSNTNLKAEEERCDNELTELTTLEEKKRADLENSYNDIIKQKELDIQNLLNICKQKNQN